MFRFRSSLVDDLKTYLQYRGLNNVNFLSLIKQVQSIQWFEPQLNSKTYNKKQQLFSLYQKLYDNVVIISWWKMARNGLDFMLQSYCPLFLILVDEIFSLFDAGLQFRNRFLNHVGFVLQ